MNYSEQELVAFVEQALAMGLQPTIHAMGSIGQSEPPATLIPSSRKVFKG